MSRILYILLLAFIIPAFAQQPAVQKSGGNPIVLRHADVLQGVNTTELNKRECIGNVEFQQGDVNAKCDRAIQDENKNTVQLIGNVIITQQNLQVKAPAIDWDGNAHLAVADKNVTITDQKSILTADKGTYSTADLVADFTNNVKIEDDSALIWADRIIYHKSTRESYAYGNVLIQGKFTNALLNGDTLEHYPSEKFTRVYGNPLLYQIDTVETLKIRTSANDNKGIYSDSISRYYNYYRFDTLSVASDTMLALQAPQNEIYTFINNVEITRGSVSAIAQYAQYFKDREYISLRTTPVVWYDSTQLHGDSIIIFIPNRKLDLIHAIKNALAASRNDTLDPRNIDQISSDDIRITFLKDSINGIFGYGNAKSLYFYTEDSGGTGASRVGSDTIMIDFLKGQANNIKWLGGIQGEYIPDTVFSGSPKDFYLPTFRWNDNRPVKRQMRVRVVSKKK